MEEYMGIARDANGISLFSSSKHGKPLTIRYSAKEYETNPQHYLTQQFMQQYWAAEGEKIRLNEMRKEHVASIEDYVDTAYRIQSNESIPGNLVKYSQRLFLSFSFLFSHRKTLKGFLEQEILTQQAEKERYELMHAAAKEGELLFHHLPVEDAMQRILLKKCQDTASQLINVFQGHIYLAENKKQLRMNQLTLFYSKQVSPSP